MSFPLTNLRIHLTRIAEKWISENVKCTIPNAISIKFALNMVGNFKNAKLVTGTEFHHSGREVSSMELEAKCIVGIPLSHFRTVEYICMNYKSSNS